MFVRQQNRPKELFLSQNIVYKRKLMGVYNMKKDKTFMVIGGDLRQIYVADYLADTYTVYLAGFDKNINNANKAKYIENIISINERVDYIILPLTASSDGVLVNTPYCKHSIPLDILPSVLKEDGIIFGGRINDATTKKFGSCGIVAIDYFEREELNILNAVPTAEGAIQIAMEELATTIYGQQILLTGFGRITKVLIQILRAMGAKITVTARKYSDLAWAEIQGCNSVHISQIDEKLQDFDIIFNTVPQVILDRSRLERLKSNALIIDLASKPGGVNFEVARELGVKVVWALSLPGKVAPITSGEIIACTILNILSERGMV